MQPPSPARATTHDGESEPRPGAMDSTATNTTPPALAADTSALVSGVERAFAAELLLQTGEAAGGAAGAADALPVKATGTAGGVGSVDGACAGGAHAAGSEGAGDEPMTAEALRRQLTSLLGVAAFKAAHSRLVDVAASDGADDDDLANGEVQRLLGEHCLEALPLMLKLIYVETRTQQSRPW